MSTIKSIVLIGCNGNAWDAAQIISDRNALNPQYELRGYLDDDPLKSGGRYCGGTVLGALSSAGLYSDAAFVYCIGSTRSFRGRLDHILALNIDCSRFASLVHPTAVIADDASVGAGAIIGPYCVIGSGAKLGNHVIVLSHSVISHECVVGAGSILCAGVRLAGRVTLEEEVYLGSGAMVRDGLSIGKNALVGMGAAVTRDVSAQVTVAGNPARSLKSDAHN